MAKAEKRALVIGVSNYNSELPDLEFCSKDGQDLYELLKLQGYSIPDEYILTGQVTYDKIRDSILSFFTDKNIKPTDTLLFYFSGHGVPDEYGNNYLAASDIDPDLPLGRGLSFKDLKSIADMSISTRIVSILDCCYAGAAVSDGKGGNANVDAKLARDAIERVVPGRCVLASSQAYQESYGLIESGHSLFTYYLLDGLQGGNGESVDNHGNITASKLSGYVYDTIMSLPLGKRPSQRPVTKIEEGGGALILANYPGMGAKRGTRIDSDYLLKLLEEEKIEEFNKIREEGDLALYLRKVDLSGKNLRGVDLHEADLSETKLIDTILTMTNLNGAKLKGANLSGADLRSANFYGASLSGANLTGADLRGADLKGMIDFAGANLTGADIRGVDLTGMVNFAGAKLHDVDFTGSATDKGLINFAGADIRNAKGLPVLHERNAYLEGLESFSGSITQQFKASDIPAERVKAIEESVNKLVEKVQDIRERDEIDEIKRKDINSIFIDMAEKVINALQTKKADTLRIFTPLAPFAKITGEVSQIVESMQNKIFNTTLINKHAGPSPQPIKTIGSPFYSPAILIEKEIETPINKPNIQDHPPSTTLQTPSPQQDLLQTPQQPSSRSPMPSPYTLDQPGQRTKKHQQMAASDIPKTKEKKQPQQLLSSPKLVIPIVAVIISSILSYVFFSGIIMNPQPTNPAIVNQPASLTSQNIRNNNNHLLTAIDQSVTTNTNTPVNITLAGSDPDKKDSLTAAIVTTPSHGTLGNINQVTGIVRYTPNQYFTGDDGFSFKVNDGKIDSNKAIVNIRVG
jgi:hypothetical protein